MVKILCIEDEESIRTDIIEELSEAGYECFGAADGQEGLKAIYDHSPDVVLCDINMPKMDGLQLLRELRTNHPDLSHIPFIFLSAYGKQEEVISGLELGADDYLVKPVDYNLLMVKLRSSLRIRDEYESRIEYEANFDSNTGLPNRVLALDRLLQELAQAHRRKQEVAVLSIGLLDFKKITDTLGRNAGDQLLKEAAVRLNACVQEGETVAHLGGYEFLLIVKDEDLYSERLARSVLNVFAAPFLLEDHEVTVTVSIGLASYPTDAQDPYSLLRSADVALSQATDAGGANYRYFMPSLNDKADNLFEIESFLRHAMERDELSLNYQPLVDIETGSIVGAEALLRWSNPELGFVSPEVFIPIAEKNGMIQEIGDWVLQTSCMQAKQWHDRFGAPFKMAVNMSVRQFSTENVVQTVFDALAQSGLSADSLELEVTEGLLMGDSPLILTSLNKLHEMCVGLSIDDFGTGYSALSYLKKYPFDTLKIDRSFVSGVVHDASNAALVTAIIAMSHGLNLKVIAEGVETAEELAHLQALRCNFVQGYHYSKPLPPDEFAVLMTDWPSRSV